MLGIIAIDRQFADGIARLDTTIAVKLTQLGLGISEDFAFQNVLRIVDRAAQDERFTRISMEESGTIDATLRSYRRLREAGYDNVGVVLQSYLYRSEDDLRALLEYQPNVRIVKGAYLEPESVAYPEKRDVDVAYLRLLKRSLSYAGYTAIDDVKLNGKLTLGENVADNGGLRVALMAYLASADARVAKTLDGFTPEQRVFLGWGQIWCENRTPEFARMHAQTNPHSPGRYRANGVVSNMPEFQRAFSCKPDAPMVRGASCRVW